MTNSNSYCLFSLPSKVRLQHPMAVSHFYFRLALHLRVFLNYHKVQYIINENTKKIYYSVHIIYIYSTPNRQDFAKFGLDEQFKLEKVNNSVVNARLI